MDKKSFNKKHRPGSNVLAIFDFDGTITHGDSYLAYLKFASKPFQFYWYMLLSLPVLFCYFIGIIPNGIAKEHLFNRFFKGKDERRSHDQIEKFTNTKLKSMIRPAARRMIQSHIELGHEVAVLSATPDIILEEFCTLYQLHLIATVAEIKDGKLTGKFISPNCYGPEKVNRLKEYFDLSRFNYIYAYGDRKSDKPFLILAHESHFKPFRNV